ncbi:hypothetical protein GGS23DRAFT_186913 [Durotheca rogersii]|uniref:uncharacterized protein n=1 Tax=Durotheca rogersii TaxID=419775 RepID=UPI0022210DB9|nr:uncharacterized protein GGS23DRAFT_186913 [Durotheca rogersii]KAI5867631.1 hypothetical protein GGS23DRAFT_186913 [Durotheca rogersii]
MMFARQIISVLALAASALCGPIMAPRASNVCVLIEGDNPYILDPFNRPQCACDCIKVACQQADPAQTDLCLRTPFPNSVFPDTLVRPDIVSRRRDRAWV